MTRKDASLRLKKPTEVVAHRQVSNTSKPGVGNRATSGFLWSLTQSGFAKGISVVGQVLLARFLGTGDYGAIGIVFSINAFAGLFLQGGLPEILLQRIDRWKRWENSIFWLSIFLGLTSSLSMVAAAPVASIIYRNRLLTPLLCLMASYQLLLSIGTVPSAALARDFRFKLLNIITFSQTTSAMILSVVLARLGFGPYSLILPWPFGAVIRLVILYCAAPYYPQLRLQVFRWISLGRDISTLTLYQLCVTITWQADNMILGRMYSKEIVGYYFWAFTLSTQTMQLIAANLAGVLLPSLAHLRDEPQRQAEAFIRAAQVIAMVGIPLCFIQAAAAPFLVRLAFEQRWYPGIQLIQILSIAWAFFILSHMSHSMLKAQGRFHELMRLSLISAVLFIVCVSVGAWAGAATGTALGVAVYAIIIGPYSVYISLRPVQIGWYTILEMFCRPLLPSLGIALLSYELVLHFPAIRHREVVSLGVVAAVNLLMLPPSLRLCAPVAWDAAVRQVKNLTGSERNFAK